MSKTKKKKKLLDNLIWLLSDKVFIIPEFMNWPMNVISFGVDGKITNLDIISF